MARSLAREGHDVVVWNRTPARAEALVGDGISAVGTVAEAVGSRDFVITSLFDTDAVLAVEDELLGALAPASVWLQTSTVGPEGARRIAERAGGRVLDTPVLGTKKPAEDGTLVVLVAGPAELRERARPVIEAIGSRSVVAGDELGMASALKLVVNSWISLITAGTAQSLAFAEAIGLDPALFLEAIRGAAVDSAYAHVKGKAMLTRDWTTSFAIDGVLKDVDLMLQAANGAAFPTELLNVVRDRFALAAERGHGDDDMAAVRAAFPPD